MTVADSTKRIPVKIGGITYQLVASENEAYIRQMAVMADDMIRRVMHMHPHLSQNMANVLALVNAMDELQASQNQQDLLDQQTLAFENQLDELRREIMTLREQNWELKKELLFKNNLIKEYEEMLDQYTRVSPAGEGAVSGTLSGTGEGIVSGTCSGALSGAGSGNGTGSGAGQLAAGQSGHPSAPPPLTVSGPNTTVLPAQAAV